MTAPYRPTIRSQADLLEAWRHLIRPLGFHRRSLWLLLIDRDDCPTPVMTEITDLPETVDLETTAGLAEVLTQLLGDVEPEGRWALLMSRPGPGPCAEADRAWAGALYATMRRCGIPHDVLHLASDDEIAPIPLDDVTGYLQAS